MANRSLLSADQKQAGTVGKSETLLQITTFPPGFLLVGFFHILRREW